MKVLSIYDYFMLNYNKIEYNIICVNIPISSPLFRKLQEKKIPIGLDQIYYHKPLLKLIIGARLLVENLLTVDKS